MDVDQDQSWWGALGWLAQGLPGALSGCLSPWALAGRHCAGSVLAFSPTARSPEGRRTLRYIFNKVAIKQVWKHSVSRKHKSLSQDKWQVGTIPTPGTWRLCKSCRAGEGTLSAGPIARAEMQRSWACLCNLCLPAQTSEMESFW